MKKEYLPIIIFPILQFIITYFVSLQKLIIISMAFIFITILINKDDYLVVSIMLIAGFVGYFSDLMLNIYSRYLGSHALKGYFVKVGPVVASSFAFVATSWMVINTWLISTQLELDYTKVHEGFYIMLIGIGIGVLYGAIGERSKAMRKFLPFYKNTSGWLESRFWDGIALVPPIGVLFLLNNW